MSGAEDTAVAYTILSDLLLGHVTFHRRPDAWDLLDDQKRVAAIICTRHGVELAQEIARR